MPSLLLRTTRNLRRHRIACCQASGTAGNGEGRAGKVSKLQQLLCLRGIC